MSVLRRMPFMVGCVIVTFVGARSQTTVHSVESVLAERI